MERLLILDDARVLDMLKRADILERFPFLRAAATQATLAGVQKPSCCGNKKTSSYPNFGGIRAAIDNMPKQDQEDLKRMLGTLRIRLYYPDGAGHAHKSTF